MKKPEVDIAELMREYQAKAGEFLTIGTAESATGGRVADRLTNVPGSSDYFEGSVVSYSNEVKINTLGVRRETIENYGAVSPEAAIEMAEGGKKLLDVDICVSVTGIAGPSGTTPVKPVGLFYIGLSAEGEKSSQKYIFHGNREENKRDIVEATLNILRQYLLQCVSKLKHS